MRLALVALWVLGTSVCFGKAPLDPCRVLLGLRGLELAPPPPAMIRSVLDNLVPGKPSGSAVTPLRRATWPEGDPLPYLRRSRGHWDGYHSRSPSRDVLSVQLPDVLLGTAVEVASIVHEHEHARIARAYPEADELEQQVLDALEADPFAPEAVGWAATFAELVWIHERHAMAAEYAVYRELRPRERIALRNRFARARSGLTQWDREVLEASLRRRYRFARTYLRAQDRVDRYGQLDCLADALMDLFELRGGSDPQSAAAQALFSLEPRYFWDDEWNSEAVPRTPGGH